MTTTMRISFIVVDNLSMDAVSLVVVFFILLGIDLLCIALFMS